MASFDPRKLGCRCDECPLGDYHRKRGIWTPVPPEGPKNANLVFIGEYPGFQEVRMRRPMIGASGQLLENTLNQLGVLRQDVYLDNAILCILPKNDLDAFVSQHVGALNEEIAAANKGKPKSERIPKALTPQQACRPHIQAVVDSAAERGALVTALGKTAHWSITGKSAKMAKVRGSFSEFIRVKEGPKAGLLVAPTPTLDAVLGNPPRIRFTTTINPAFAVREAPYKEVLLRDIQRGMRWLNNELDWQPPVLKTIRPTAQELEDWLREPGWWSWDVETTGEGELQNKLRTIGLYCLRRLEGVIVPWVSIDGKTGFAPGLEGRPPQEFGGGSLTLSHPRSSDICESKRRGEVTPWWHDFEDFHYSEEDGRKIRRALVTWFESEKHRKIGHFSGYFDSRVIARHLGVEDMRAHFDQILLSRIWNSELPRSLYFVGTMFTDVPAWKAAEDDRKISHDPRSYEELAEYNAVDVKVTAITGSRLISRMKSDGKIAVSDLDHKIERVCDEMRVTGLYVHEPTRLEFEEEYREKKEVERKTIREVAGPDFNPASTKQLAELLYRKWKIPCPLLTKQGKESTSEDAIRKILTSEGILPQAREPGGERRVFIEALWRSRGIEKALSTVILPFRRRSQGGVVYDDGVMRSDYSAHIPATGRMSSGGNGQNTQNIEALLRRIIRPRPGHVFVISDFDQIELRLVSAIAGVESYMQAFRRPKSDPLSDPHAVTALLIYGDFFQKAWDEYKITKNKVSLYTDLRRFAKIFVYAVIYGGTAETVYASVSKATDDDGNLLFPDMTLEQVQGRVDAWMRNAPEIPRWWDKILRECSINGYVEEPILGRRRHMPALDRNKVLNLPIQGAAAAVMSLALLRLRDIFPPDFDRGIGIVNQMHDALTLEVPEDQAERAASIVTETLTSKFDQVPGMTFTSEAKVCLDFSETEWLKETEFEKALLKAQKEAGKREGGEAFFSLLENLKGGFSLGLSAQYEATDAIRAINKLKKKD